MVYLGGEDIIKREGNSKHTYPTPKHVSELTDDEIKDYLVNHQLPRQIASPIDKPEEGMEFVSKRTPALVSLVGPHVTSILMKPCVVERGGYVKMDTYYNKILARAVERGLVKLYLRVEDCPDKSLRLDVFSDVYALHFKNLFLRDITEILDREPRYGAVA